MKKIVLIIILALSTNVVAQMELIRIHRAGSQPQAFEVAGIDSITYGTCHNSVSYEGKTYSTRFMDSQCWLIENLNVGTRINGNLDQTDNHIIEKYCYDDDENNCNTYGGLYQWAEAVQYKNAATNTSSPEPAFTGLVQGICPAGWHIPGSNDYYWLDQASYNISKISDLVGDALKVTGQGSGDGVGNGLIGFYALLTGYRNYDGSFKDLNYYTYFWSTYTENTNNAYSMIVIYNDYLHNLVDTNKKNGYSVRCIKD